jgi:hypothetical protein
MWTGVEKYRDFPGLGVRELELISASTMTGFGIKKDALGRKLGIGGKTVRHFTSGSPLCELKKLRKD